MDILQHQADSLHNIVLYVAAFSAENRSLELRLYRYAERSYLELSSCMNQLFGAKIWNMFLMTVWQVASVTFPYVAALLRQEKETAWVIAKQPSGKMLPGNSPEEISCMYK